MAFAPALHQSPWLATDGPVARGTRAGCRTWRDVGGHSSGYQITLQGPEALRESAASGAEQAAAVVRRLLADAPGAQLLLLPLLPGGPYEEPMSARLEYPNRCARRPIY